MQTAAHRASALRRQGLLAVLRYVHGHPGVTRVELTRALGLSSGSATELTTRLKAQRLIDETEAPPTGGRGRPSPALGPHPAGPLVCAVDISHEQRRVAIIDLAGHLLTTTTARHTDPLSGEGRAPGAERAPSDGANGSHGSAGGPFAGAGDRSIGGGGPYDVEGGPSTGGDGAYGTGGGFSAGEGGFAGGGVSAEGVLGAVRRDVAAAVRPYGERVRLVSVSVAATVQGTSVVQAAGLGWSDVPVELGLDVPLLVGNDASLAGLAEARRGAGAGGRAVLHLTVEVGAGGVLIVDGRPMDGATGAGGEFGHLPFGDPSLLCPCGARGCWDLEVDGRAMARLLGEPPPADPRTEGDRIVRAAAEGSAAALEAVAEAARRFGRGAGGLVNALDPDLVTLSGLARDYAGLVGEDLRAGYLDGLMRFRRADPPPLRMSELGAEGPLIGAAEVAFDRLFTDEGLAAWESAG